MAKVITVSRKFPKGHINEGQPTYFVERILNALEINFREESYLDLLVELNWGNLKISKGQLFEFWRSLDIDSSYEKLHTIRNGNRWEQGDKASLRVWYGKPYNSPQIIFAPDVELVEVYRFNIYERMVYFSQKDRGLVFYSDGLDEKIAEVAKNDGLTLEDFKSWFKYPRPFEGQILCWKNVNYL